MNSAATCRVGRSSLLAFVVFALVNCSLFGRSGNQVCTCELPTRPTVAIPAQPAPLTAAFLVDRTTSYAHVENDLPLLALHSIEAGISQVEWHPGDTVYGVWMTPQSPAIGEDFLPLRSVPRVAEPKLSDPEPAPTAPVGQVGCTDYCGIEVPRYTAALATWQQTAQAQIHQWQVDQDAAVAAFVAEATKVVSAVPSPRLDNSPPDIYGALFGVSRVFAQPKSEKGAMKLAIFSGLIEKAGPHPDITLSGVQVLVEAYHRHGAEYQRSGEVQWRAVLTNAGATVKPFIADNATSPTDVGRFL